MKVRKLFHIAILGLIPLFNWSCRCDEGSDISNSPLIDAYNEEVNKWKKKRHISGKQIIDAPKIDEDPTVVEVKDGEKIIKYEERIYESAKTIRELVFQDNSIGFVYPGSLIWTQPLLEGRIEPFFNVPTSSPILVSLTGVSLDEGTPNFTYEGGYYDFVRNSTPVINSIKSTAPRIDLKIARGKSLESAFLGLGLSARYWTNKFSGSLSSNSSKQKSFAVVTLNEVYYTMTSESNQSDGYLPISVVAQNPEFHKSILIEMEEKGEIGVIRRVEYGRRVLIAISSESNEEDLQSALRLSVGGAGMKINANVDIKETAIWNKMDAQAIVVGGRQSKELANVVTGDFGKFLSNVNKYLQESSSYDKTTVALPISFEVRYSSDNEAFSNYETADFAGRIPISHLQDGEIRQVSAKIALTGEDARILQDDNEIDSDDWTGVDVSYSFSLSSDRRAVNLEVVMNAYELESNRDFERDNTHIRTAKIFRVFELKDGDKRLIKEVRASPQATSVRQDFGGELHDWITFNSGTLGALRDLRVHVDGNGSEDTRHQGLNATVDFVVEIDREY